MIKTMNDLEEYYHDVNYQYSNNLSVKGKFDIMARSYELWYGALMPDDTEARILDLACGAGQFLYYLKRKGYRNYWGVDKCLNQINYVKQYVTDNGIQGDVFDYLPMTKPNSYDLIVANDFIEHLDKDEGLMLIGFIYDALKEGGRIILKTANMAAIGGIVMLCNDLTHKQGYTEKSLSTLLRLYDYQNIQVSGVYPKRLKLRYKLYLKAMEYYYKRIYGGNNYPRIYSKLIYVTGKK